MNEFSDDSEKSRVELQKLFEAEYSHLFNLIKILQNENN